MIKRAILLFITVAQIFLIVSCKDTPEFSHCELVIPLTEDYTRSDNTDFDVSFSNGRCAVAILRLSFSAAVADGIPETMTATEFGELWLNRCERDATVKNESGATFAEYYDTVLDSDGYYLEAFYRSHYAYFVILFATDVSNEEAGRLEFLEYAAGVYFLK